MTADPIRILAVDDHPLVRRGIATLVGSELDLSLVAEASNGREAIQHFRAHRPDVTLIVTGKRADHEWPNAAILI